MVPEGWSTKPMGSLLERVSRPVELELGERYTQIGVRSHGKGIFIKEPVTGKDLGNKRVFWVEPGCLVLNIVFAWEQAVAVTDQSQTGMIASHRFPMYASIKGKSSVDYLRYLFLTPRGKYLLGLASPGGAGRNKTLGQKEFERLAIAIPPLAEQKKIAEILSTWDKAIATSEKLLANAEVQKKALMQQLLTGKRRLKGFKGEWREVRLGDIIRSMAAGVSVNSESFPTTDDEIGVLKTSCISSGYFDAQHNKRVNDPAEISRVRCHVKSDTILMSRMNTPALVGASGYVAESHPNLFLPDRLWSISCLPERVSCLWLSYWLATPRIRAKLSNIATGTSGSMKNITKGDVRSLRIETPSLEEQHAIANMLSDIDAEISHQRKYLSILHGEKRALMQQLLTGKRRVAA